MRKQTLKFFKKRKKHRMKIQELHLMKAARGIIVEGVLSIPTQQQSTNETIWFENTSPGHSVILAVLRFRRKAKALAKERQKVPGPYPPEASSFIKGLLWT